MKVEAHKVKVRTSIFESANWRGNPAQVMTLPSLADGCM